MGKKFLFKICAAIVSAMFFPQNLAAQEAGWVDNVYEFPKDVPITKVRLKDNGGKSEVINATYLTDKENGNSTVYTINPKKLEIKAPIGKIEFKDLKEDEDGWRVYTFDTPCYFRGNTNRKNCLTNIQFYIGFDTTPNEQNSFESNQSLSKDMETVWIPYGEFIKIEGSNKVPIFGVQISSPARFGDGYQNPKLTFNDNYNGVNNTNSVDLISENTSISNEKRNGYIKTKMYHFAVTKDKKIIMCHTKDKKDCFIYKFDGPMFYTKPWHSHDSEGINLCVAKVTPMELSAHNNVSITIDKKSVKEITKFLSIRENVEFAGVGATHDVLLNITFKNGDYITCAEINNNYAIKSGVIHKNGGILKFEGKDGNVNKTLTLPNGDVYNGDFKCQFDDAITLKDISNKELAYWNGILTKSNGTQIKYEFGKTEQQIEAERKAAAAKDVAMYKSLCNKYGKKYVDAALVKQPIVGMPEELLKAAFRLKLIEEGTTYKLYRIEGWGWKNFGTTLSDSVLLYSIWIRNGKVTNVRYWGN